ncbi:hypothetical protein [Mycobacteroides abscessus]
MHGVYHFDLANADPAMIAEVSAEAQRIVEADGNSCAALPTPQPGHKLAAVLLAARDATDETLWAMDLVMSRERIKPGIEGFPPFQELVALSGISLSTDVNELRAGNRPATGHRHPDHNLHRPRHRTGNVSRRHISGRIPAAVMHGLEVLSPLVITAHGMAALHVPIDGDSSHDAG